MSSSAQSVSAHSALGDLHQAVETVNQVLLGKSDQIKLAFACLLANGHLLIEDLPGVGKTTLAHAIAQVVGTDWQRIQFTSDVLPADILGVSIYRRDQERFEFHPGPVFTSVILADEVNRATPKTQSALLEAMAEGQVTVEGKTRGLPSPFFVIATQNPSDMVGTYPLPESQLDRFLLSLSLGYPDAESERQLLTGESRATFLDTIQPCLSASDVQELQQAVTNIYVSDELLDYIQSLINESRQNSQFKHGLSPRAGLALLACSRAHALLEGRDFVIPEDVKIIFPALARHRLHNPSGEPVEDLIHQLLNSTAIP